MAINALTTIEISKEDLKFSAAHFTIFSATERERLAAFPGVEIESSRIAAILAHDQRARLPSLSKSTLVICAADDAITPLPYSQELAAKIPGATLTTLPMGGHFAPQVDAAGYNTAVLSFLTGKEMRHA